MRAVVAIVLALGVGGLLRAQDAARLREAFEGRNVTVKIDMPATKDGIDIYPNRQPPLDFRSYQARIKNYGIAVRQGESILVTKVLVKERLIEFQLGGGGYGTFGDESSSSISPRYEGRSKREKDLEDQIRTAGGDQRRALERELDSIRRERERVNAISRAEAAQAQEMSKARIEQKRKEGGSRFNIRFEPQSPPITAEGLMAVLAPWVDFGGAPPPPLPMRTGPPPATGSLPLLRKGMSRGEVDALLGTPIDITERNEGAIRVATAVYDVSGVTAKVEFAAGVLLKFLYQSR